MNLENQTKESPLEKAKRLKAEKESRDQARAEDENRKKAEKLELLNASKKDLESQLEDINSQIEISRNEAHETRDTMKEGDLDKDEDFKEDYRSTISEVAGNLNELRNEKNRVKAELEKIELEIENFEVNEAISEGKEAIQGELESINQKNEEALTQIESHSGADAEDFEEAKEVINETNKKVSEIKNETEGELGEIVDAQLKEDKLKKLDSLIEDKKAENDSLSAEYSHLDKKLDDILLRNAARGSSIEFKNFCDSFAPDFETAVSNLEKELVELVKSVRNGEKSQSRISGEQQISWLQQLIDRTKYNINAYGKVSGDLAARVFLKDAINYLPQLSMLKINGRLDKYRNRAKEEREYLRKIKSSPEVIKLEEEHSALLYKLNNHSKELSDLKYEAYNLRNEIWKKENKTKQEKTT